MTSLRLDVRRSKLITMTAKIAMIVAHDCFRDEEYFVPKTIFEQYHFMVTTVSSLTNPAKSKFGKTIPVDIEITQLLNTINQYQAIVFVGGPGTSEYFDNPTAHSIAQSIPYNPNSQINKQQLLCAICIAPVILAKAGVLRGKNATVFPSGVNELKNNAAAYLDTDVVQDNNIITASGPEAAGAFANTIVQVLKTKPS